jgi:hypothetical protein
MSTPKLHLETTFVLDTAGRITSTREPQANRGPLFSLVRSASSCAWAVRSDVAQELADELNQLAREEPPISRLRDDPVHAARYQALLGERVVSGPVFTFPQTMSHSSDVVTITDERLLERHFRGWVVGEIAAGRAPVMAIRANGYPVSVCFSARWSPLAAHAGVETAPAFRARAFAPRVTAAWALAIRASGGIPLYQTGWSNVSSLAVARKLGLDAFAADWSVWDL